MAKCATIITVESTIVDQVIPRHLPISSVSGARVRHQNLPIFASFPVVYLLFARERHPGRRSKSATSRIQWVGERPPIGKSSKDEFVGESTLWIGALATLEHVGRQLLAWCNGGSWGQPGQRKQRRTFSTGEVCNCTNASPRASKLGRSEDRAFAAALAIPKEPPFATGGFPCTARIVTCSIYDWIVSRLSPIREEGVAFSVSWNSLRVGGTSLAADVGEGIWRDTRLLRVTRRALRVICTYRASPVTQWILSYRSATKYILLPAGSSMACSAIPTGGGGQSPGYVIIGSPDSSNVALPLKIAFESYHWSFQIATGKVVHLTKSRDAQCPQTGPDPPGCDRWS